MDRLMHGLETIHDLRMSLDRAFGNDFVAEITRLETELQRHYDATLDDSSLVQHRFMLAKMLGNLQEIRRLLAVQRQQVQVLNIRDPRATPSAA